MGAYPRAELLKAYRDLQAQGLSQRQTAKRLEILRTTLQAWRGEAQGHLVFQFNPDKGQSLYRLGSQPTARSRNVRMACPPEQAYRGVT
jgi:hypothetical protein